MKKILNTGGRLAMAAALMAMAACSGGTAIEEPAPVTGAAPQKYTMIIRADKAPAGDEATRALSLEGKTLSATWAAGDVVDVYAVTAAASPTDPNVYTKAGTLTAMSDGASTTLKGTVTLEGKPRLWLYYGSPSWSYTGQKGTLEDIAEHYDYATATLSSKKYDISEGVITPVDGTISFSNNQAIVKFSLRDADGQPISAKNLRLKKAGDKYFDMSYNHTSGATSNAEHFTVMRDEAASDFYVAMRPINDFDLRLETAGADKDYWYERTGVKFEAGKYYEVTVKMKRMGGTVNLAKITGDFELVDGDVLTGTLDGNTQKVKLTIEDGATVTLSGAAVKGVHYGGGSDTECVWAGLTCLGDATIVLADGTTNTVTNFNRNYPCIQVDEGKTLVIKGGDAGTGKLIANAHNSGAGIGGGWGNNCGNIVIQGGDITATSVSEAAGIGGGGNASCGSITIKGGTVTATGGAYAAGIGSGKCVSKMFKSSCNDISITGGTIRAKGGENGAGIGCGEGAKCGNISITGGDVWAQGLSSSSGIGCGHGSAAGYESESGNISISDGLGFVKVVAVRGDEAIRSIGISNGSDNIIGDIIFDGETILYPYRDEPEEGTYGSLLFTKSTQKLGDEEESVYYNNTWTLTRQ